MGFVLSCTSVRRVSLTSSPSSGRCVADATTAAQRLDARRRTPHARAPRHRGRTTTAALSLRLMLAVHVVLLSVSAAVARTMHAGAARPAMAPNMPRAPSNLTRSV